jgi:hypothetical protein
MDKNKVQAQNALMQIYSCDFGAAPFPGELSRRLRKLSARKVKKLFKQRLFAIYRG